MKPIEVLTYVSGADVLINELKQEAAIHEHHGYEDSNRALPWDSGPRAAAEIYGLRLKTTYIYAGTLICRLSGVNLLYRGAKHFLIKEEASE